MANAERSSLAPAVKSSVGSVWSWIKSKTGRTGGSTQHRLLADDDYEPARFGLSNVEEWASFEVDDRKRPFAMHDDLDERTERPRPLGRPAAIEESEPD